MDIHRAVNLDRREVQIVLLFFTIVPKYTQNLTNYTGTPDSEFTKRTEHQYFFRPFSSKKWSTTDFIFFPTPKTLCVKKNLQVSQWKKNLNNVNTWFFFFTPVSDYALFFIERCHFFQRHNGTGPVHVALKRKRTAQGAYLFKTGETRTHGIRAICVLITLAACGKGFERPEAFYFLCCGDFRPLPGLRPGQPSAMCTPLEASVMSTATRLASVSAGLFF